MNQSVQMKNSKIKEDPSLMRDGTSGAIVNRNSSDYHRRLASKRQAQASMETVEDLKKRIAQLEALVQELIAKKK